jgi:hypothetical protein
MSPADPRPFRSAACIIAVVIRRTPPFLLATLLALSLSCSSSSASDPTQTPSSAGPSTATSTAATKSPQPKPSEIAPGVSYKKIVDPNIPLIAHVLIVDPSQVSLEVTMAKPDMPGSATTSSMAAGSDVIAAVNGDLGLELGVRPAHLFVKDGEIYQTPLRNKLGKGFGIPQGEPDFRLGTTNVDTTLTVGSASVPVAGWNCSNIGGRHPPCPMSSGKIYAFTARGGSAEPPPEDACSVRLIPTDPNWSRSERGMSQDVTLDTMRCGHPAMDLGDGLVLATKESGAGAHALKALPTGESGTLSWSVGWRGVTDIMGGSPRLIKKGKNVAPTAAECTNDPLGFCLRNPRSGVGITADQKIVFIVAEGRSADSAGVTLAQFSQMFLDQGAVEALNFDGGGSATMVIDHKPVNFLSDGYERDVCCAVLITAPAG